MSDPHSAAPSLLGYLYQCRYALLAGLDENRKNPGHELSIEKFDDVAFDDGGRPTERIQTKHSVAPANLTDKSVDLWRTLDIWVKRVQEDPQSASETRFVLITTGRASAGSALSQLRIGPERNVGGAARALTEAAKTSTNRRTQHARDAFLGMHPEQRELLLFNIWVFDAAPNIVDVRVRIEESLVYSVSENRRQSFVDHLEGWWFRRVIESLTDSDAPGIPLSSIQDKIYELQGNFQIEKLPLDQDIEEMPPIEQPPTNELTFVNQMRCVELPLDVELSAIHDYYRASAQRSLWARESLLLDGEAERYDRALCDAWRREFQARRDETGGASEDEKRHRGRELFHWANRFSKPFRNRQELWLSAGSFQILADKLRIGWHCDFERLMNCDRSNE